MVKIAHKVLWMHKTEVTNGGEQFFRITMRYACGRQGNFIIEKELYEEAKEGWPEGTRLCKSCEKEMRRREIL